jgi:hypothetical protein
MNNVRKLISEAAVPYKTKLQKNQKIVQKWERSGLLEGINETFEKNTVAILLENQAKQLLKEASRTGTAEGSEEWSGVALPLVRRIFSEISSKEFVSVQPMNLPSGLVFWLDIKYGTGQAGFTTGSGKDSQADSIFGVTETAGNPNGGLYGAGRFGYTINDYNSAALSIAASPSSTEFSTGSLTAADYNYDTEFSSSYATDIAAGNVFKLTVSSASLTNHDAEGIRAFVPAGNEINAVFQQFTNANSNDSQISFIVSGSSATGSTVIKYHKQPSDVSRGDFEDRGSTLDIPELNIELKQEQIVAKTRKLKAVWTPEFAQDLNAYHAVDAEQELTGIMSEYVSMEVDLEILDMLIKNAQTKSYWSARVGREWNGSAFADLATAQAQASSYSKNQWFETLGIKIKSVSNKIHQKTMRGGANFIVASPSISTIFESIPGFTAAVGQDAKQYAAGVKLAGNFDGQYQVYKHPYLTDNTILMGYRGQQFLETGAVYSPYVPMITTPMMLDPDNFTPRKGIMSRYAKKVVRPEFYGLIYVDNLGDV